MAKYYIVPRNEQLDISNNYEAYDINDARRFADRLHEKTGDHYHVVKVETVWSTTTLADLLAEQPNRYKRSEAA